MFDQIDQLSINTVRMLSMDQINQANSGHPGLPLGAAPMAYTLWTRVMNHNPKDSKWFNRDRFVLSAGHGSALLYSLLHLSGYKVSLDELKNFRQLHANTAGHPEYGHVDGVEATTGPLGQGLANAVGMAMAEAHLAARFNKDDANLIDHYTYVLCGDGDLMEGVTAEASSLAGHLKLGKLIVLYDSNDICLDGPISTSFSEDVKKRYEAYDWQVLHVKDGNDCDEILKALEEAKANTDQPTLIEVKTEIGYGSPLAGTNKVHGAPLGEENTSSLKEYLGWETEEFIIDESVTDHFNKVIGDRGHEAHETWNELLAEYEDKYPEDAAQLKADMAGELPENWAENLPTYKTGDKALASRKSSEAAIQVIADQIPSFWGGSADLFSSNNTYIADGGDFLPGSYEGKNIWYGVREFAMAAILNGIILHGGSKSYCATFFVFSDYMKAAVRLAALSEIPSIFTFTHDSVAVGEDGPTHEPIEQLAMWRALPNLQVIRPADGNETSQAWRVAIKRTEGPTMLVLSRQNLPVVDGTETKAKDGVDKGAYVIAEAAEEASGIIIATGSEVALAVEAKDLLAQDGIHVNVVSMPSWERFDEQDEAYRESVLPKDNRNRMSVEAGATFGWEKYLGFEGLAYGIDRFGASGEGGAVMEYMGFSADQVAAAYKEKFGK